MEIKRNTRYIKGTEDYVLSYKKRCNLYLKAFTDVDWGGRIDDTKRTSLWALFIGK